MRLGIFAAAGVGGGAAVDFLISPAYAGKSAWSLAADGPLNIGTFGEYTITPLRDITVTTKMWGAGGARGYQYNDAAKIASTSAQGPGGGGGYSTATIVLRSGSSYIVRVGQGGARTYSTTPTNATYLAGGVSTATFGGAQGGGYTGLFKTSATQGNALLMAGGGGGGSDSNFAVSGGAGGGTSGQTAYSGGQGGGPGTSAAGGAASIYNGATVGTALTGGRAGNGGGSGGSLGGGGGGYFGGGGGNVAGGGGGSGLVGTDVDVSAGTTTAGSADTPANSADADRNGAGRGGDATSNTGADGRIILSAV